MILLVFLLSMCLFASEFYICGQILFLSFKLVMLYLIFFPDFIDMIGPIFCV